MFYIMQKECPRCGNVFICREDNIMECECIYIPLSPEAHDFMANHYKGCLCSECLTDIGKMFEPKESLSA